MTALKCVVEGCDLEYDVVCSFSFYNVNTSSEEDGKRQEWIEGAMHEESECLWRHVSLQLCGYHFELDSQGLWIDSPMLPELLTAQDTTPTHVQTEDDKKIAEIIRTEHNYCEEQSMAAPQDISRLNVRQLVDTLGYLSLKNLQRKQLWVVKVETDKSEASITQSEQVIAKMQDPKQIIEIVPQSARMEVAEEVAEETPEADASLADNFIYEIAEEQEITMEEVNEIPSQSEEWMVNIIPEENKPKYAYIKHCNTGKKKRHFTADMSEVTFQVQGDFDNYYILPDIDPSSGVEITTSYEPENYIVDEYQHLVLEERPKKRGRDSDPTKKRKKKAPNREPKQIQIKNELGEDWVIQAAPYEQFEEKKGRARRKNKKFLGVDKHVFGIN